MNDGLLFRDYIKHEVRVNFEPRDFTGGYTKGPKMAHMIEVPWRWENGAWEVQHPKVFYARVKKSGDLYDETLNAMLWRGETDEFADVIEASRPQYQPVPLGVSS